MSLAAAGRASGLVKQSYRLLFFAAFFVEAFFVLFLAVFLAAIKWLLHVRRPLVRPHARSGTPNSERAVIASGHRCESAGGEHVANCADCFDA